jgi:uncharacterized membrane protein
MIVTIFYIILAMWIYSLHQKIDKLEVLIKALHDRDREQTTDADRATPKDVDRDIEQYIDDRLSYLDQEIDSSETISSIPIKSSIEHKPYKIVTLIKEYFTHGNILVRVGAIILFFGLAFLVKYVAEHSIISIEMRVIGISLLAISLIILGWILRYREGGYGLILQGVGIAILYLAIYGSAKFFSLISLQSAFAMMLGVVVIGSTLAIVEDALVLVLFATVGGFLVPILTSDGSGLHIVLFSYYAILNIGIFAIAWFKSWRVLNIAGFISTFVIATSWGILRYEYQLFETTEPFLILFFSMYLTISILFTIKYPYKPHNLVDATLIFGLPLVAFPLQLKLVEHIDDGDLYTTLVLGTLYLLLFITLRSKEKTKLLAQTFLALGVLFYTLSILYAFDTNVAAALWALESTGIIWIALKQSKRYTRYFGEVLLIVAIILYPISYIPTDGTTIPYINGRFIGYLIIIISTLISSYLLDIYHTQLSSFDMKAPKIYILISILLWLIGGSIEAERIEVTYIYGNIMLIYLSITALIVSTIAKWLEWTRAIYLLRFYLLLGILFICSIIIDYNYTHPFGGIGIISLGIFYSINYILLHYYRLDWERWGRYLHLLSLWSIATVAILEVHYRVATWIDSDSWAIGSMALPPIVLAIAIMSFKRFGELYRFAGTGGLVTMLSIWEIGSFSLSGDPTLLPYIPILNPLDMIELIALATSLYWVYYYRDRFSQKSRMLLGISVAFMVTILSSVIYGRAIHNYMDILYSIESMWHSIIFQAGISILWSLLAISLMLLSKRYSNRPLWIGGFSLLIIVVIKLLFVELGSSGTIERIISFIVVGTLLLLIGYFAPLPPIDQKSRE